MTPPSGFLTVRTSFTIENRPVAISASGVLSRVSNDVFQLRLAADLGGLQDNITDLLRPLVDKSNKCGERVSLQRATLVPAAPASLLTVYVHYEKWACAKAFGKEIVKRLVEWKRSDSDHAHPGCRGRRSPCGSTGRWAKSKRMARSAKR